MPGAPMRWNSKYLLMGPCNIVLLYNVREGFILLYYHFFRFVEKKANKPKIHCFITVKFIVQTEQNSTESACFDLN